MKNKRNIKLLKESLDIETFNEIIGNNDLTNFIENYLDDNLDISDSEIYNFVQKHRFSKLENISNSDLKILIDNVI